jgi:hypothetical protein
MGFLNHFLGFADRVILYEVIQARLLLRGQFPELQSDLAHSYRTETEFALDFKIGDFLEGDIIQAQSAAAQNDFQLPGICLRFGTVYVAKGQSDSTDIFNLTQLAPVVDQSGECPFDDLESFHLAPFDTILRIHGRMLRAPARRLKHLLKISLLPPIPFFLSCVGSEIKAKNQKKCRSMNPFTDPRIPLDKIVIPY